MAAQLKWETPHKSFEENMSQKETVQSIHVMNHEYKEIS